jgi:hypothetical protein
MKFMLIPRASDEATAAAHPPDEKAILALMKYNEDMHKAGVLVTAEGLNPAAKSAHVRFSGGKGRALDGPYAETKELIGGFYMLEVKSLDEAVSWALRYPGGFGNDDVVEIRPLTAGDEIPKDVMALIAKAAPTWFKTLTKKSN